MAYATSSRAFSRIVSADASIQNLQGATSTIGFIDAGQLNCSTLEAGEGIIADLSAVNLDVTNQVVGETVVFTTADFVNTTTLNLTATNATITNGDIQTITSQGATINGNLVVTGTISNFTGSHLSRLSPSSYPTLPGMIVSSTGRRLFFPETTRTDYLVYTQLTTSSNDKSVMGAIANINEDDSIQVIGVGEGAIWVIDCGGIITPGTLLTSSDFPGFAKAQDSDIFYSYTIGKSIVGCFPHNSHYSDQALQRGVIHVQPDYLEMIIYPPNISSSGDTENVTYRYTNETSKFNEYIGTTLNIALIGCTFNSG